MTKRFSRLLLNLVIFLFFAGLLALEGIVLAEPVLVPAPRSISPRVLTQAVVPSPTQQVEQPASTGIPTVPPGDPQVPATPAPAPLPQAPPPLVPVDSSPPSAGPPPSPVTQPAGPQPQPPTPVPPAPTEPKQPSLAVPPGPLPAGPPVTPQPPPPFPRGHVPVPTGAARAARFIKKTARQAGRGQL